jgi:hypothetical protein
MRKEKGKVGKQTIQEGLDLLIELEATLAELEEEKAQAIEAVIPHEVKEHIKQIETEFADQIHVASVNIASTKAAIKDNVLALGSTVKGIGYMAVWSKGRVTWDGKGLNGYMIAHPEIEAFRKEGKPSVSIRRRK